MCGFAIAYTKSHHFPGAGNRLAVYPNALLPGLLCGGRGPEPSHDLPLSPPRKVLETISSFSCTTLFPIQRPPARQVGTTIPAPFHRPKQRCSGTRRPTARR